MPAYWVARAKINDPVEYKKYTDQVPGILEKYGATVLARGGDYETLEGPKTFERFIVIEFPSMDAAKSCFESDEYKEAARFRRANNTGQNELTIVEGSETLMTA